MEIQGPAASGKTHLIYRFTIQCILPEKVPLSERYIPSEVEIGGWERAAIIMDTDGRWSVQRLRSLLTKRLERALPVAQPDSRHLIQQIVTESLRRVHIFRVKSSASLAATLLHLPVYHSQHMADEEIALLAIDSIGSFYWVDKYDLEQRQRASDRKEKENPLSRILIALQEFRLSYGPAIVLTNWGLTPLPKISDVEDKAQSQSPFYRQHLHPFPAPFENPPRTLPNAQLMPPITHHITLTLPPFHPFPLSMMNLQDALEESDRGSPKARGSVTGILRIVETGTTAMFSIESFD